MVSGHVNDRKPFLVVDEDRSMIVLAAGELVAPDN
jgi:hypothetical protein